MPGLKLIILKIHLVIITIVVICVSVVHTNILLVRERKTSIILYDHIHQPSPSSPFFFLRYIVSFRSNCQKKSAGIWQNHCWFKSPVFFQLQNVRLYVLDFHTENIQELCGKCVGHAVKHTMPKSMVCFFR